MYIKVEGLDMAYSEASMEDAAQRVAEQFGVVVEITDRHPVVGGGGWPTVAIIGTPAKVWAALTAEGGWSTGDAEEDAETAVRFIRDAKVVYGG